MIKVTDIAKVIKVGSKVEGERTTISGVLQLRNGTNAITTFFGCKKVFDNGILKTGATGLVTGELIDVKLNKKGEPVMQFFCRTFSPVDSTDNPVVQVVGRLTRDVEKISRKDDKGEFVKGTIAVNTNRDKTDPEKETTVFTQFTTNVKLDPAKHTTGEQLILNGFLKPFGVFEKKDGTKGIDVSMSAVNLEFGAKPAGAGATGGAAGTGAATKTPPPTPAEDEDDEFAGLF